MNKLFRLLFPLALVFSVVTITPSEVFAKKSSSSKSSKQKSQGRADSKKSSTSSSRNGRQAKSRKPHRRTSTVANSREKNASPAERDHDRSRLSASQMQPPLSSNQGRNNDGNSSADQNSQEANQQLAPPAPRPVISSIPIERVAEIQTALIKHGYLDGEASGIYDDSTKAAMKKFQVANHLQASGLPSAHALKKLGVSKRGNSLSQVPVKTKSDVEKEPPQE